MSFLSDMDPKKLRMYGLVGSVVGIYLGSILNSALDTNVFSFIGAVAAIFAVVMGANCREKSLCLRYRHRSSIHRHACLRYGHHCGHVRTIYG